MKKKWIVLASEEGKRWNILTSIENTSDEFIPINENIIYEKEMSPSDFVVASIIPSARIIDDVKMQLGLENQFYLKISTLIDDWYAISSDSFLKEDVINLAKMFVGLDKRQAERIWCAKKMGELNTEVLHSEK